MATTIVGRLVQDPELKFVGAKGTAVVKFSVAVNKKRGDKEETSYFDVSAWGTLAENVANSLTKGGRVIVSGELTQERWEKEGKSFSRILIDAKNIGPDLTFSTVTVPTSDKAPANSYKARQEELDAF